MLAALVLAAAAGVFFAQARVPDLARIAQLQVEAGPGASRTAQAELEALARAGVAQAQRAWGDVLVASPDRPRVELGLEWLQRALEAGDANAALSLGKLYLHGAPTLARDRPRALAAFETGARAGHAGCAYYLASMYSGGYGVPVDKVLAARWLTVAAERKIPVALFMLGNAYRYGEGVARDEARALALYSEAAELELPQAIQTLALAHQYGELGLPPDGEASRHAKLELAHALKHPALDP